MYTNSWMFNDNNIYFSIQYGPLPFYSKPTVENYCLRQSEFYN